MFNKENVNTVIITGSNGTLAKHLISILQQNHYKVLSMHHNMYEIEECLGTISVDRTCLIHCAFARTEDENQIRECVRFSEELFSIAINYGILQIVNISSKSVYGKQTLKGWNEDTVCYPDTNYAKAKIETENILVRLCTEHNYVGKFTNLRMGSLISPDIDQRVVNKLVKRAKLEHKLDITNAGNSFQYMDVRDAAEAISLFVDSNANWDERYCIGAHSMVSLKDIAENIVACGQSHNTEVIAKIENNEETIFNGFMDSSRFEKQFDWHTRYSIYDMVDYIWIKE